MNHRVRAVALALAVAALSAGCADGRPEGRSPAAERVDPTHYVAAGSGRQPVGNGFDFGGVTITLDRLTVRPKGSFASAARGVPASWATVEMSFYVANDSGRTVSLRGSRFSATAGKKPVVGAEAGPGGAPGAEVFAGTPLPTGVSRLAVKTVRAATARGIVFRLTPAISPAPSRAGAAVEWTGDASS